MSTVPNLGEETGARLRWQWELAAGEGPNGFLLPCRAVVKLHHAQLFRLPPPTSVALAGDPLETLLQLLSSCSRGRQLGNLSCGGNRDLSLSATAVRADPEATPTHGGRGGLLAADQVLMCVAEQR